MGSSNFFQIFSNDHDDPDDKDGPEDPDDPDDPDDNGGNNDKITVSPLIATIVCRVELLLEKSSYSSSSSSPS